MHYIYAIIATLYVGISVMTVIVVALFVGISIMTVVYVFQTCGVQAFFLGNGALYAARTGMCGG